MDSQTLDTVIEHCGSDAVGIVEYSDFMLDPFLGQEQL